MAKSKTRRKITVADYSPLVLTCDYVLRWLSLGIYRAIWGQGVQGQAWVFGLLQVLVSLFTVGFALYREGRYRAHIDQLPFDKWSPDAIWQYVVRGFSQPAPYELIGSSFSVVFRVFAVLTFGYMAISVVVDLDQFDWGSSRNSNERTLISVAFTFIVFFYGAFVLYISSISTPAIAPRPSTMTEQLEKGTVVVPDLAKATTDAEPGGLAKEQPEKPLGAASRVDVNDSAIIELEGELKNLSNRVEAYILESVMFGALTFSGFLTLLASDDNRLNYAEMQAFGIILKKFLLDLLVLELDVSEAYDIFTTVQFLIIWIMFLTLICSMFFLFVIASRIKFTSVIEKVDNSIRLARAFNTKEEEVYVLHLQFENIPRFKQRLDQLSQRIEQQMKVAHALLDQVKPVVYYMGLFRNLGVFLFLIIIIISLLFFSNEIAITAAVMVLSVYVYKRLDDWYRKRRLTQILARDRE
jgi:hypothetical protein